MTRTSLAIVGGVVASEDGLYPADIKIQDGRIAAIAMPGSLGSTDEAINASGLLILPGILDIHLHCRAPGNPERGDFATETRAAAAGGVTTIFEMPVSKPACSTPEVLRDRRSLGETDCYVNFALYGAPGTLDRDDVQGLASEGAIGFKIFMTPTPPGRDDEFYGLSITDEGDIYHALMLTKETGLRCAFHAESPELLQAIEARVRRGGRKEPIEHAYSRPVVVEATAIAKLITMSEMLDAPIHIAHLSSKAGLELVRHAQARGVPVTAETCPHYLFFDKHIMNELGPYAKINPPLRDQQDIEALWEGLHDGTLAAVTTDHSPFLVEEKELGWDDIFQAPPGAPGVETLLPLMMDAAASGRLSVPQVVKLLSSSPARLFGLYPKKGIIQTGSDADLTLFDPDEEWTIDPEKMFSKSRLSDRLYKGRTLKGRVISTVVGGKLVYERGEIVGARGGGSFVRPPGFFLTTEQFLDDPSYKDALISTVC